MKIQELLDSRKVESLRKIIVRAEDYIVVQNIIKPLPDIPNVQVTDCRFQLKTCIPDRPQTFIGRDAIVRRIISSLLKNSGGIVSIFGESCFGKSSVAVEVCHHLNNDHDLIPIFSFLSHASTILEVSQRLCHDVGVNPGEDPESSLIFWLKSIEKKVVFVMDNIEQLLDRDVKSQFIKLVLTLHKNSRQHLQILTTSRKRFVIPGHTVVNHQLEALDKESSVALLRKCCPLEEIEDEYLSELAKLCGFVPLALCIAGTIIPDLDDPSELIQWLREKAMEALSNSDQCVQQTIQFSFQKLNEESKTALVCLSVFDGNFEAKHAKEIIEKSELKTLKVLNDLLSRSLIQGTDNKRFVIHPFIRQFLADHDQFKVEQTVAKGLMVKYFLKVCHSLTMDCYSYNGYTSARESLKKDIHNVEETLRICTQDQTTNLKPNILEFLTSSDIYKFSSSFFYLFSLDFVSASVLRNFFESCIQLAESRQEPVIEITFQCLVAEQEGRKSAWKSPEYIEREKEIKEAFLKNKETLKDEKFLLMFCDYFFDHSDCNKAIIASSSNFSEDVLLSLPNSEEPSIIEKVARAHMLMNLGKMNRKRAKKEFHKDEEKGNEYMSCAKSFFNQALSLAKELLGKHKLTCLLYKFLGDLYLSWNKNEEALTYYTNAISLQKDLNLVSDEMFVFLLKECGVCLASLCRFDESIKTLLEARDLADKLTEKHTSCRTLVYCDLARTCRKWQPSKFPTP